MKPVTKTASHFRPTVLPRIKKDLKKKALNPEIAPAGKNGYLLIAADGLSPEELASLAKRAVPVKNGEDLLERVYRLEKENRQLKSLSVTDELTGLFNKRFFNKQMTVEIARAQRTGEPFCLILIDLDNFKTVNDTLGHIRGDEFLIKICRQIKSRIRPTDYACRFGGDEFAMILPAMTLRDGVRIAGRWHQLILQVASAMRLSVSSSIGVDEFNPSGKLRLEEFVSRVDQFLYQAKNSGKGKIAHPEIEIPESSAVSRAEKEILYHIFHPSLTRNPLRQAKKEKK